MLKELIINKNIEKLVIEYKKNREIGKNQCFYEGKEFIINEKNNLIISLINFIPYIMAILLGIFSVMLNIDNIIFRVVVAAIISYIIGYIMLKALVTILKKH